MEDHHVSTASHARGTGAKHVYDVLRREILALHLAPGTPLDETSLSNRFAMSRSPIREALVRLSSDGLVEMLSNRTTLVAPIDLAGFPRYVEALDMMQRINTRLAARNRLPSDMEAMALHAQAFDRACEAGDYLDMSETNRAFHMAIADAGKNPYFARPYGLLLDDGRRILHMHFEYIQNSPTDRLLNRDHYEMIDAIAARDVEKADLLAHAHTRQFHDNFMQFLRARYEADFDFDKSFDLGGRLSE